MAEHPAPEVAFRTDPQQASVPEALFVQEVVRAGLAHVRTVNWPTESTGLGGLTGSDECEVVVSVDHGRSHQALLRHDGTIVSLWVGDGGLRARIAGDEPACARAEELLQRAFPRQEARRNEVPIVFWLRSSQGPQQIVRQLSVPAWDDIAFNYSEHTAAGLSTLMQDFRPAHGGQLLLWHGEPGTGKTFGIRALAWEWRSWCDFHYVVDPDKFFEEADYMMGVLLQHHHHQAPGTAGERWRLFILEDTGEMIRADAKERVGQGLSRLLNVVDGLIGQGLHILVLITTNEKLGELHAAVARPGRCAADVEFLALAHDDARAWLARRGGDPDRAPADATALADLYALVDGFPATKPVPVPDRRGDGLYL